MQKIPTLLLVSIAVLAGGLRADDAKPAPVKTESLAQLPLKDVRARAEAGDAAAQFEYGKRLNYGSTRLRRDEKSARGWLGKSATQGYGDAKMLLVEIDASHGMSFEDLTVKYRELAGQGIPAAQYKLYQRLQQTDDPAEGFGWLQKSAAAGYPEALVQMGVVYSYGEYDIVPDSDKALEWYKKAFDAGVIRVGPDIAQIYLKRSDAVSAITWLKKTDKDGRSIVMLGDIYCAGAPGVAQDLPHAYVCYVVASSKKVYGDLGESVIDKRRILAELLTDVQKAEAQKFLAEAGGLDSPFYTSGGGRAAATSRRSR